MTEQEWLASTNPEPLLEFLRGRASDRKLRLAAVACCRRAGDLFKQDRFLPALLACAEGFAEGTHEEVGLQHGEADPVAILLNPDAIAALAPSVPHGEPDPYHVLRTSLLHNDAWVAAWNIVASIVYWNALGENAYPAHSYIHSGEFLPYLADVLIDSFGNPFCPVTHEPSWLTWNGGTVRKLGQDVYKERAFDRLPILADALEDAGCTSSTILEHCRQRREHVHGCWLLDLLLLKE